MAVRYFAVVELDRRWWTVAVDADHARDNLDMFGLDGAYREDLPIVELSANEATAVVIAGAVDRVTCEEITAAPLSTFDDGWTFWSNYP